MDTARLWLGFAPDCKHAAVYFNEGNVAMVISRDGDIEPFASSRFRDSLKSCIVYMSQAQVRGVDMQFPVDFEQLSHLGLDSIVTLWCKLLCECESSVEVSPSVG